MVPLGNSWKIEEGCASCGAEMSGGNKYMAGRKYFCSKSCIKVHARKYQIAMHEAQNRVIRRFYGL